MAANQVCSFLLSVLLLTGAGLADAMPLPADPRYDGWSADNTTLTVLMYHHLVEDPAELNEWRLTVQRFREDLQWLQDNGYTTVLPSELAAGRGLPEKAVMITFDDGYTSNYTLLYPLLREFGAKAVISVIAQRVEDGVSGYLTWDMCREMAASGLVEIGSHTYNLHGSKPVMGIKRREGECRADYEARVFPDIQRSIDCIAEHVGAAPLFFAYPYGRTDLWAADFLAEHFAVTVTTEEKTADLSGGLYALPRYNISMKKGVGAYLP